MKLHPRATVSIPRSVEDVFDLGVACDAMPRFLRPVGPIPGVDSATMHDGAALAAGARRRVVMTDQSVVEEEIVALERPRRHAYRWVNPPAPPFSLLVRGGEADWTFAKEGGGTRVEWVYALELTTPLVYPLAALVAILFRRWMQRGLEELRTALVA